MANHYNAALEQAKGELKSVSAEVQRLLTRKTTLENLVKTLTSLSTNYATEPPATPEMTEKIVFAGSMPVIPNNTDGALFMDRARNEFGNDFLWKQIARMMKGADSFTISQAGEAIEKARNTSLGHTRSQQVRNSLTRHEDVFRRNEDGTWTVIKEVV